MRAFGARLDVLPSDGGKITPALIQALIARAKVLSTEPNTFWTDQFNNPDNPAGYQAMAEETIAALGGRLDEFVMMVGTSGLLLGERRRAQGRSVPGVRCVAGEPATSRALSTARAVHGTSHRGHRARLRPGQLPARPGRRRRRRDRRRRVCHRAAPGPRGRHLRRDLVGRQRLDRAAAGPGAAGRRAHRDHHLRFRAEVSARATSIGRDAPRSDPPTRWLSCHVDYACRHSGACCRSGLAAAGGRRRSWRASTRRWSRGTAADRGRRARVARRLDARAAGDGAAPSGRSTAGASSTCRRRQGRPRRRSAPRHCAVHTALGHDALPASCQHFPRVCLIDDRGVRVSLSHYCPTAAAMIVDDDAPGDDRRRAAGRAGPRRARGTRRARPAAAAPHRSRADRSRRAHGLGGARRGRARPARAATGSPEHARRADGCRRAAAGRLVSRLRGVSLGRCGGGAGRRLARPRPRPGRPADSPSLRTWPAWFEIAAATCRAPWLAGDPPAGLAELDARYVAPVWERHAGSRAPLPCGPGLRRVDRLSGRRGACRWRAWLTLCHAVLRIEIARACGGAARAARPRPADAGDPPVRPAARATTPTGWRSRGRLAIAEQRLAASGWRLASHAGQADGPRRPPDRRSSARAAERRQLLQPLQQRPEPRSSPRQSPARCASASAATWSLAARRSS